MEPTMRARALTALLAGAAVIQSIGALAVPAWAAGPVSEVDVLRGSTPLVDCSLTTPRRFESCSDPRTNASDLLTGSVRPGDPTSPRGAEPADRGMSPEGKGPNPGRPHGAGPRSPQR